MWVLIASCLMWVGSSTAAETDSAAAAEETAALQAFLQTLNFRTGDVKIWPANASVQVAGGYRYLEAADARKVLEELWGNPPDSNVLGMLVPDAAPLDSADSWAVVLTYSADGYVADDDANQIDYNALLVEMQEQTRAHNQARKEAGFPGMELVGWAQPPRYDASSHKLHWAKELATDDSTVRYLNYDVRVLGRSGFLSLNAVADMRNLPQVQASMDSVLAMASFNAGHRYADYDASTDKAAGYGLAALVGGGLAAKSGLFAKLGILLLKFWKLAAIGAVLIGVGVSKLLGRKQGASQ
jgi:uncharacterized membrane-anchored protein